MAKTPNGNIYLSQKSQSALITYLDSIYRHFRANSGRDYMEWIDRQYARKWEMTPDSVKSQALAMMGDPTKFRNLIYPIIMPQVESAVAYQAEYFCSGTPLFPVVTTPEFIAAGNMLESVIARDANRGAWACEFIKTFRDAYKYNRAGLSCYWETVVSAREGAEGAPAASIKPIFAGNKVARVDMYNAMYDTRIPLEHVATMGEFAGETVRMPMTALRALVQGLPNKYMQNYNDALNSDWKEQRYVRPTIGVSIYTKGRQDFSWDEYFNVPSMTNNGKTGQDLGKTYEVTTVAIRIRPTDFGISGVAAPGTPQIFKMIVVNWQHIISFQQLTTEHDMLPYLFARAYEDGLQDQTASMAENLEGMQQLATAKINGVVASMRRMLSDRAIYNPMVIESRDVNSDSPTAKIALKASSMLLGDATKAYYPIPYNANTEALSLAQLEMIEQMSYKCSGQNPARQGQFVKGNKTREEYNSVMDNATAGDNLVAIQFENRLFTPLKLQLRHNVLRYQGAEVIFNQKSKQAVDVRPGDMENAILEFQIGDGKLPASKLANTETLVAALQTVQSVPALQVEYPPGKIFATILTAGGIKIEDYRYTPEQIQYNQQLTAWQQAAAQAAEKGAAFNTPMPTPPSQPPQQ